MAFEHLGHDVLEEFAEASYMGVHSYPELESCRPWDSRAPKDAVDDFIGTGNVAVLTCVAEHLAESARVRIIPTRAEKTRYRANGQPSDITIDDADYIRAAVHRGTLSQRGAARLYRVSLVSIQRLLQYKVFRHDRIRKSPQEQQSDRARAIRVAGYQV